MLSGLFAGGNIVRPAHPAQRGFVRDLRLSFRRDVTGLRWTRRDHIDRDPVSAKFGRGGSAVRLDGIGVWPKQRISAQGRPNRLCVQFIEQRLGIFQVGGVEAHYALVSPFASVARSRKRKLDLLADENRVEGGLDS